MKHLTIKKVLIVGAGTMGKQIAVQCALYNFEVALYDINAAALDAAHQDILSYLQGAVVDVCRPHLTLKIDQPQTVANQISLFTDACAAAENADLLIETAPEQIALKIGLFQLFHEFCPKHTIFTSNTSSLVPEQFKEGIKRPEQFALLHFHPVVMFCPLVDIMPWPLTSGATLSQLKLFCTAIKQTYHEFEQQQSGYVFNSLAGAWLGKALELLAEGIASPDEIDKDWMLVTHMKYGPFGYFDCVGLDVIHDIIMQSKDLNDKEKEKRALLFKRYLQKGWLGAKTLRGFYKYPNPRYLEPEFLQAYTP